MTYEDARLKEIAECECRYQRRIRRLFGAAVLAGAFVSGAFVSGVIAACL